MSRDKSLRGVGMEGGIASSYPKNTTKDIAELGLYNSA